MKIETVKIQGDSYLVNNNMIVPTSKSNKDYKAVQEWINEGNTPAPEFTEQELIDQAAEKNYQDWKSELEKQKDKDLRAQYKKEKGL